MSALRPAECPVFIPVRDRLESLEQLVIWLERAGHEQIWLIDNASSYPPLMEYLARSPHHVVHLGRNLGHRSPWLSGLVQRHAHGVPFVVSDPDVVPVEECPLDAVLHFGEILERHVELHKVGFGLKIDDLPEHYPLADEVRQWEAQFWAEEIEPGVYRADIDTTFALHRAMPPPHENYLAARTGPPYTARHLAWYVDSTALSDDERYYREHADTLVSNWNRDRLARWKLIHRQQQTNS